MKKLKNIDPEVFWHKQKVVKRRREIELMKLDYENTRNESFEKQILPISFCGTHTSESLWAKIKWGLRELLP